MASTIQLQRTILVGQQFLRLAPLLFDTNINNDPAFTAADWVMQQILSPPLAWRWNRISGYTVQNPTFTTTVGLSDYPVSIPNFGWIEKATAYDTNNANASYELSVDLVKSIDTLSNQPTRIAAQYDNNDGTITFRLFPAPDSIYNVVIEAQNAAQLFTTTAQTWDPIPDYLSDIYNQGFLSMSYQYANDPRWVPAMQLFFQMLAQRAEGLSETQRNIFLEQKLNSLRQTNAVQQGKM